MPVNAFTMPTRGVSTVYDRVALPKPLAVAITVAPPLVWPFAPATQNVAMLLLAGIVIVVAAAPGVVVSLGDSRIFVASLLVSVTVVACVTLMIWPVAGSIGRT